MFSISRTPARNSSRHGQKKTQRSRLFDLDRTIVHRDGQERVAGQRDGTAHHDIAKLGPERHARGVLAARGEEPEQAHEHEKRAPAMPRGAKLQQVADRAFQRLGPRGDDRRERQKYRDDEGQHVGACQRERAEPQRQPGCAGAQPAPDIISLRASAARYSIRSIRLIGYMRRPSQAPGDRAQYWRARSQQSACQERETVSQHPAMRSAHASNGRHAAARDVPVYVPIVLSCIQCAGCNTQRVPRRLLIWVTHEPVSEATSPSPRAGIPRCATNGQIEGWPSNCARQACRRRRLRRASD